MRAIFLATFLAIASSSSLALAADEPVQDTEPKSTKPIGIALVALGSSSLISGALVGAVWWVRNVDDSQSAAPLIGAGIAAIGGLGAIVGGIVLIAIAPGSPPHAPITASFTAPPRVVPMWDRERASVPPPSSPMVVTLWQGTF